MGKEMQSRFDSLGLTENLKAENNVKLVFYSTAPSKRGYFLFFHPFFSETSAN